jgi:hypothetical protein
MSTHRSHAQAEALAEDRAAQRVSPGRSLDPPLASPHLVPLAGGFQLWRWFCVRSAGFPAALAAPLAAAEATARADGVLALEAAAERAYREAQGVLERESSGLHRSARKPFVRAVRQLERGLPPSALDSSPLAAAALTRAYAAQQAAAEARARFAADWLALTRGPRSALREIARLPEFQKALSWQNRGALETGIAALLRQPPDASDFKTRQNEALVASYVQRYALKNESIGFFGPVVWGRFELAGPALTLAPGPALVAAREVYFEFWGIDRLAQQLSAAGTLRRFLPPRLLPSLRLEGSTLHYPIARRRQLADADARLLALCDGTRSALQLAEQLAGEAALGHPRLESTFDTLAQLAERGVISWELSLSPATPYPERALRAQLEAIPNHAARREGLAALDELERLRGAVAAAHTEPGELARALTELDAGFERITGQRAKRREGATYAARTLLYEDCRRDLSVSLGPALRQRLARPLELVLRAARWYTHQVAERMHRVWLGQYRELAAERGEVGVDFQQFFARAREHLSGGPAAPAPSVKEVASELAQRFAQLLGDRSGARHAELDSAALAPRFDELFSAPGPGWPSARHHSPDVLIAARDAAAFERGELTLVLGELHAGWNSLCAPLFVRQHPDPSQLRAALDADLPQPRIAQVEPKQHATRLYAALFGSGDRELELGTTRSARPHPLQAAELEVALTAAGLVVRSRTGTFCMDIIAFMESYLLLEAMAHFRLVPPQAHTPRISIDGLVVARESWRMQPDELAFAHAATPSERFLGARRLQRRYQLPRYVFVKVPQEAKPYGVDFDSSVLIEIFAHLARKSSSVTLSEMLPAPDELWLVDRSGQAYTSELRLIAVDPLPYRPLI